MSEREKLLHQYHDARREGTPETVLSKGIKLLSWYINKGEYKKARRLLETLEKEKAQHQDFYLYKAVVLLQDEEYGRAREALDKELQQYPNNSRAKTLYNKLMIHQQLPVLTITLLVFMLACFLIIQHPSLSQLIQFGANHQTLSFFSVITSLFLHANPLHLIANMVVLGMFGLFLEKHIGSPNFLFIFLSSGVIGNGLQALVAPGSFVIGASAGVFGILGASMMREPMLDVRLFGMLKIPIVLVFGAFFAIENLFRVTITSEGFLLGTIAHLFGFLTGILIAGTLYRETISVFYHWLIIAISFWLMFSGFDLMVTSPMILHMQMVVGIIFSLIATYLIVWSYTELTQQQEYIAL